MCIRDRVEDYVPGPSPPPTELAQPPEAGTDYEPASKTLPPPDEPDKELNDAQQSRVDNDPEQEPRPGSAVNVDYEPLLPEGQCADVTLVPTISELKMRSESQLACYFISSVLEQPACDPCCMHARMSTSAISSLSRRLASRSLDK